MIKNSPSPLHGSLKQTGYAYPPSFGNEDVKCVRTSVGPEQEYFLITEEMYEQRKDIRFTGRTLFGAKPPKGQEMDDHYLA